MDIRKIKTLIEMLEASNLNEIEVSQGEESVRISKSSGEIKVLQDSNIGINNESQSINKIDNNQISSLEIPPGNPLLIELSTDLKIIKCKYLDKKRAKDLVVF